MQPPLVPDRSDAARLAAIGRGVGRRLAAHPDVQHVDAPGAQLYVVQQFLSGAECAALIAQIDAGAVPSAQYDGYAIEGYRTSSSCNLDAADPLVRAVETRISDLLGLQNSQAETVQGQRYHVGQQFKPHHDFFHRETSYYSQETARGGQRSWTAMLYLNEPAAGGATGFPRLGIVIEPRAGMLVVWNNMARDGTPNLDTLHAGEPVLAGTKYVLTKWFREEKWL